MPTLSNEERNRLVWYAEWYLQRFRKDFVARIQEEFPHVEHLRSVVELEGRLQELIRALTGEADDARAGGVDDRWVPLLKRVALAYRLDKATELERLREKTAHLEILERLDEVIRPLDVLAARRWFREAEPHPVPCLGDFLDLETLEKRLGQDLCLPEREYDEKFHILQAPSLFLPDLRYYRGKCALRGAAVAVAFLDIDHFKHRFNSRYGETAVDRAVLPRFMRAVEAHVAFHGHAYRQGGDEYLVLLPGLSRALAVAFLDELRRKLAELAYPGVEERTTVTVGVCVADPDCPLTDRELRERANQAGGFAKQAGRNCIATYRGSQFEADDLYVAAPGAEDVPTARCGAGASPLERPDGIVAASL